MRKLGGRERETEREIPVIHLLHPGLLHVRLGSKYWSHPPLLSQKQQAVDQNWGIQDWN